MDAANARRGEQWDPWSLMLALTYNANRPEKSSAMSPEDWHPIARTRKRKQLPESGDAVRKIQTIHDTLAAKGVAVQVMTVRPDQVIDE